MKLIIIAAIGKNNELGKDNKLIWHIKEDLEYFKKTTINHSILMGKNTFLSLGKPLKNRHHIILSSSLDIEDKDIEVFKSLEEFMDKYKDSDEEIYVIGGSSIYKRFIDLCSEVHLTEIDSSFEADTFFPEFNEKDFDKEVISEYDTPYQYKHVLYKRR